MLADIEGERNGSPLRGRDMLCFSHDWTGDPLSKNHLMRVFARHNRILWINSIGYRTPTLSITDARRVFRKLRAATARLREVESNIFVFSPLAIPAYGNACMRALNRQLLRWQVRAAMRRLSFRSPISWVFNPAAAVVAGALGEAAVIYYCVDEYSAFAGVNSAHLGKLEESLLRKSDAVIVSAESLYESKSKFNPKTVMVRHGVDHDHFVKALDFATCVPEDLRALPRPILGFFGLIADWIDFDLLAAVAHRFSQGSVVLIGKCTTDVSAIARLPNVRLLGQRPYATLPAYCKGFDVALIPFRINRLTLNANPLKVREYLAAGLPVVSTALPEVVALRLCAIAQNHAEFIAAVESALRAPGPALERSELLRSESWTARIDEIAMHLKRFGVIPQLTTA